MYTSGTIGVASFCFDASKTCCLCENSDTRFTCPLYSSSESAASCWGDSGVHTIGAMIGPVVEEKGQDKVA